MLMPFFLHGWVVFTRTPRDGDVATRCPCKSDVAFDLTVLVDDVYIVRAHSRGAVACTLRDWRLGVAAERRALWIGAGAHASGYGSNSAASESRCGDALYAGEALANKSL